MHPHSLGLDNPDKWSSSSISSDKNILSYYCRFQSGCQPIMGILQRPLSLSALYRSVLSLLQCCSAMKLSSFTHQTSAFLYDSGVWVALSQYDSLLWTMLRLLLKARHTQDGQCHSGLDSNAQYVWWMSEKLHVVTVLTKRRQIKALSLFFLLLFSTQISQGM